jgi:hypothetical protein
MGSVLLRTAGGTLLYIAFLWFVQVDDWRVAGMMLTFPMLNGMALVSAGEKAFTTGRSMVPVVTLNGAICFLFALALAWSASARTHVLELTVLAGLLWLAVYRGLERWNVGVPARAWAPFAMLCVLMSAALTYWLWPPCAEAVPSAPVRAGGLAGVLESRGRIALFALSLLVVFGVAHVWRDAHAAVGRLGALPLVPLLGLYTVGSVLAGDPAAVPKLETMRSLVLVGWMIALVFAVLLAAYVARSAAAKPGGIRQLVILVLGWGLCLAAITFAARVAPTVAGCASG